MNIENKTYKVALVNKFFFQKGGAETVLFQEKALLQEEGFEVIEFSMQHEKNFSSDYADYFVSNTDYHKQQSLLSKIKISVDFIHNQEACKKFTLFLKKERPDIVHFHNIYHQLTPSIIKIAKKFGCKTILTAHDYKIACPSYSMQVNQENIALDSLSGNVINLFKHQWQEGSWSKSILLSVEALFHDLKGSYAALDLIIAPSEFMKKAIQSRYPEFNVEVIGNGIDADKTDTLTSNSGYFLYVGRLIEDKGIETLAQAHQLMKNDCALKVAGVGPMMDYLQKSYPNAEFLGFQSGDALIDLIANCTAVIVPSQCYENCSMSLLEAMAYKKAVIGADIGGIPEQIVDSKTGFLFESGNVQALADKMDLLAKDPVLASKFGEAGRERLVDIYSLQAHKKKLLTCFDSLLENKESVVHMPSITVIGTRGIPNVLGGVETHCEHLYTTMKAQQNCDICVIARSPYVEYKKGKHKKVSVKSIWAPKKKSFEAIIHSTLAAFSTLFDKSNIVHVHAIGPGLVVPLLRVLGKKVVFTHHGPDYDRQKWGKVAKGILLLGEYLAVKYSNEVIVISEVINNIIKEKYNRQDAHLIYNGVEKAVLLNESEAALMLAEYGLEKHNYLVTVGRFVEEKGFHDLIDAYRESGIDLPLVIIGDSDHPSPYSEQLKRQAASTKGVVLTGFLKGDKLKGIFSQAKTFIIPSYHEGLPIALLEALSYSLPVIASDIPANKEVGLPADNYFTVGDTAQLAKFLVKQTQQVYKVQNYQTYLALYDWNLISVQVFEIYKKILNKH